MFYTNFRLDTFEILNHYAHIYINVQHMNKKTS